MPNIVSEIPETYNSVTRPVCVQMIKDLVAYMGLPKDTGIDYYGVTEAQYQSASPMDPTAENKYGFTGRVYVEVEEEYIEERTLTTAVRKPNEQFIFSDPVLGIHIKPVYVRTEVAISFRYRAPDRTSALRWRDRMRLKVSEGQQELLHEFDYHYPLPKAELLILRELWRMREAEHGYGEDLKSYLRAHFSPRVVSVTNQVGRGALLSMAERQVGVIGWFDFMAQPDKGGAASEGAPWEIGFEYRFQYDKPVACAMRYPIVVHNQVVDQKYRQEKLTYELANIARRPNDERRHLDKFTRLYTDVLYPFKGVRIPEYDDWVATTQFKNMYPVLTLLMGVNPEDPRELFSLKELGTHEFTPQILTFLADECRYLNLPAQTVFNLHLFHGDTRMEETALTVDADLNVRTTVDLDPRKMYHVVMTICDLKILSPQTLERLRQHGQVALDLVKVLYPQKSIDPKDIKLLGDKLLPRKTLQQLLDRTSRQAMMRTVGSYSIIVRPKEDLHADS